MDNQNTIILWDYWADYEKRRAYCIGIINGILYFSEAELIFKNQDDDNEGEEWKK